MVPITKLIETENYGTIVLICKDGICNITQKCDCCEVKDYCETHKCCSLHEPEYTSSN